VNRGRRHLSFTRPAMSLLQRILVAIANVVFALVFGRALGA
jgi:hypothetical protein